MTEFRLSERNGKLLESNAYNNKTKRILELGTAVGYSAILMSEAIEKDASIITIENYEKRIVQARDNFKKADKEDVITMLEGDAMENYAPALKGDSF